MNEQNTIKDTSALGETQELAQAEVGGGRSELLRGKSYHARLRH